jgi:hypothetical protein
MALKHQWALRFAVFEGMEATLSRTIPIGD